MTWLTMSPDLNPIELFVSRYLKEKARATKKSKEWQNSEEWQNISRNVCGTSIPHAEKD